MRRLTRICLAMTVALVLLVSAKATATVLYDPALAGSQNWNYRAFASDLSPQATTSVSGGRLLLDTSPRLMDYAGYFSYDPLAPTPPTLPLTLDRNAGFTLSFNAAIVAESHTNANRGGFSFLFVTSDKTKALELAFQAGQIFNYDSSFVPEHIATRSTVAAAQYDVSVLGDTWQLSADGAQILSGTLVDYTSFPPIFGIFDPYEQANTIFFGDDTTSASASVSLGAITLSPVPEPGTLALLAVAAAAIWSWRRGLRAA